MKIQTRGKKGQRWTDRQTDRHRVREKQKERERESDNERKRDGFCLKERDMMVDYDLISIVKIGIRKVEKVFSSLILIES